MPNFDIVAFDQRGTGASGKLSCKALRKMKGSIITAFAKCVSELGVRRGYYRSSDSSEDIEAVRQAIGSPKLSLSSPARCALRWAATPCQLLRLAVGGGAEQAEKGVSLAPVPLRSCPTGGVPRQAAI